MAHPVLTSGAIGMVALMSVLFFREPFHLSTGIGILLIVLGVSVLTVGQH